MEDTQVNRRSFLVKTAVLGGAGSLATLGILGSQIFAHAQEPSGEGSAFSDILNAYKQGLSRLFTTFQKDLAETHLPTLEEIAGVFENLRSLFDELLSTIIKDINDLPNTVHLTPKDILDFIRLESDFWSKVHKLIDNTLHGIAR